MDLNQTISNIIDGIKEGRNEKSFNKTILEDNSVSGKNEFLMFVKPELTLDNTQIKIDDILSIIFSKLQEFNFGIKGLKVVNAKYLEEHKIISQHYGVINQLSREIKKYISEDAKDTFKKKYNLEFEKADVLGAIEFQEKFSYFTPTALSVLWQNSPTEKLAGGTYSQQLSVDGAQTFLINGFHPRQLEHFTAPNRTIIVLTLTSDTDWNVARNSFIGKTNPQDADEGSIRRILLEKKDSLGLADISSSFNGVHLSAGPVEGLIELMRYDSNFDAGEIKKTEDYSFGKTLISELGKDKTDKILQNPTISYEGKDISVFDLTEEMNSDECLELLKKIDL